MALFGDLGREFQNVLNTARDYAGPIGTVAGAYFGGPAGAAIGGGLGGAISGEKRGSDIRKLEERARDDHMRQNFANIMRGHTSLGAPPQVEASPTKMALEEGIRGALTAYLLGKAFPQAYGSTPDPFMQAADKGQYLGGGGGSSYIGANPYEQLMHMGG